MEGAKFKRPQDQEVEPLGRREGQGVFVVDRARLPEQAALRADDEHPPVLGRHRVRLLADGNEVQAVGPRVGAVEHPQAVDLGPQLQARPAPSVGSTWLEPAR